MLSRCVLTCQAPGPAGHALAGVRDYGLFIHTLGKESENIRRQWTGRPHGPRRPPRIFKYDVGVLPYRYPEAYIYETLTSHRHCWDAALCGERAQHLDTLTEGPAPVGRLPPHPRAAARWRSSYLSQNGTTSSCPLPT
jgi:hypothetical protein